MSTTFVMAARVWLWITIAGFGYELLVGKERWSYHFDIAYWQAHALLTYALVSNIWERAK